MVRIPRTGARRRNPREGHSIWPQRCKDAERCRVRRNSLRNTQNQNLIRWLLSVSFRVFRRHHRLDFHVPILSAPTAPLPLCGKSEQGENVIKLQRADRTPHPLSLPVQGSTRGAEGLSRNHAEAIGTASKMTKAQEPMTKVLGRMNLGHSISFALDLWLCIKPPCSTGTGLL